jgi:hypothetical protein
VSDKVGITFDIGRWRRCYPNFFFKWKLICLGCDARLVFSPVYFSVLKGKLVMTKNASSSLFSASRQVYFSQSALDCDIFVNNLLLLFAARPRNTSSLKHREQRWLTRILFKPSPLNSNIVCWPSRMFLILTINVHTLFHVAFYLYH